MICQPCRVPHKPEACADKARCPCAHKPYGSVTFVSTVPHEPTADQRASGEVVEVPDNDVPPLA
jgi:hypothetical protein